MPFYHVKKLYMIMVELFLMLAMGIMCPTVDGEHYVEQRALCGATGLRACSTTPGLQKALFLSEFAAVSAWTMAGHYKDGGEGASDQLMHVSRSNCYSSPHAF
ncbi:hypothetical protein KIL84_007380 [Mauremys mutica]|uniref:Secreted protein n=1 Tax=Mauremys mutica TaxID=74926 RepID=A0A9D4AQ23_9SAUR|nr:hypothetical protein KIL84_007380 [Mauremys mutica]